MPRKKAGRKKTPKRYQPAEQYYDSRYYYPNIIAGRGWESEAEQRKELSRMKKNVRARLKRLEKSPEYRELGMKKLMELPFADVIADPSRFSMQEQLAAFSRAYYSGISITALRTEQKMREEWAAQVADVYLNQVGSIGFDEFMAAARYSGLIDIYGSEAVARMQENVEENRLDAKQVLSNYNAYARHYGAR